MRLASRNPTCRRHVGFPLLWPRGRAGRTPAVIFGWACAGIVFSFRLNARGAGAHQPSERRWFCGCPVLRRTCEGREATNHDGGRTRSMLPDGRPRKSPALAKTARTGHPQNQSSRSLADSAPLRMRKPAPYVYAGCKYSPHPKNEGCGIRATHGHPSAAPEQLTVIRVRHPSNQPSF
jgi:hypothetical protein